MQACTVQGKLGKQNLTLLKKGEAVVNLICFINSIMSWCPKLLQALFLSF